MHNLRTRSGRDALRLAAVGLLALAILGPGCWPGSGSHDSVFTDEGLISGRADTLKSTVITAHLEQPVSAGKNVLWCSTFQLAWNEVCTLIGEDVHMDGEPPEVAILNKKTATKEQIDDGSCLAMAGFVRDDIAGKVTAAMEKKFHGQASPRFWPPSGPMRPQDIVAYSYLFKHLRFPEPFGRLDDPLDFGGKPVSGFGFEEFGAGQEKIGQQVAILDYRSPADFIVELQVKSADDRLILARVQPQGNLEKTVSAVLARAKSSVAMGPQSGDVLKIPKTNFDLTRDYEELCGHRLKTANPAVAKDLVLFTAVQNIRFQMNEKGVALKSEAYMHYGCSATYQPKPTHIMVFDHPFLILMVRKDAAIPYFALWVDNSELLVGAH